jgi:four helix bundle protein
VSAKILSFRDLRVYQEACKLDLQVFAETKRWPKDEKFALIDQIRRSSRSIGANLGEAWAKRRYEAHFVSKLTDSDGELQETEHWLFRALEYGYLVPREFDRLNEHCLSVGRMLGKMINNPAPFLRTERDVK